MSGELYERLQRRRGDFERDVTGEFADAFGPEDAEDLVSTALDRVLATRAVPDPEREVAWFRQVVFNVAIDEYRHRHGRRRAGAVEGVLRRPVLLSTLAEAGFELADLDAATPELEVEALDESADRERVIATARQVLEELGEEDVRLLLIRHVEMPDASRARCAEAAGLTVDAWRHRYVRAWRRFAEAVAAVEPTDRCADVRRLIGELDAGALGVEGAKTARGCVDAHIVECAACHVFARESYRILVLTPVAPAGSAALQRVTEYGVAIADRNAAEAATGAGAVAGGAGLFALLGSGGISTGLKVLAIVCGVSVTTAGLCGGLIATYEFINRPPENKSRAHKPEKRKRSRPVLAQSTPVPTMAVTASATARPPRTPQRTPSPRSTASPNSNPPAAVAAGATGDEFTPIPASSTSAPAPVPAGVQSEFSP